MTNITPLAPIPMFHRFLQASLAGLTVFLTSGMLNAAPSPIGTGLKSNITLGALQNSAVINRQWPDMIDYDVNLSTWTYDVYVPPGYDGTKPFGVVIYTTSDPWPGVVLQNPSNNKNIIWIAPRGVGNDQGDYTLRFGASLLAIYRAKELFNIDPRRIYTSGKSGGARIASALAFYHSEIIRGTAPSSGFGLPRLNEVTPDYITKPTGSNTPESFYNYSYGWFFGQNVNSINTTAKANKLRSYLFARYNDYREEYFVESFHCAYEPQGQICFLSNRPGEHTDPSDLEMEEAIDYLDRDDVFPVNANITAGAGGFSGMTNISQSGASAVEATSGGNTNYTLTPTLTAVAAAKSGSSVYWDNTNGSTVRWLWEVKNAAPTNQKTSFGLWFANETWGGGAPVSVTAGSNPGVLITITQNGSQNRMVVSARPDSGGETIFYDGYFSFVPAYSTAWTSTQTGYLTGTGSPVEIRMDLNQKRWQLTFNGIKLDGSTNSIASGTDISRDNRRSIFGYWNSAVGGGNFWKHDPFTSWVNTWSPFTKSIFTAATGAISGAGATPSPMELRYVIASDPSLPDPPPPGPTGLAGVSSNGAVNLSWNAFAGATSYTIQRSSVSGGPYTTIQSGIAGTSYTDSTVTAGNIYYYTLFATTASGNSATVTELAAGGNFQVDTWTGGGADNNWQTAANWNSLPVASHTLAFAGTTRLSNTNNFPANTSFGGLTFNSGAGAFTLAGNAIALTGDIANNGTSAQTVNLPVALAAGAHGVTTNTGNLSLGGVISGSGSLSKSGTGTATLSGSNTYNGGTTITAGTLGIGSGAAVGNFGATGTTVTQNAGTLSFTQSTASTNVAFANNLILNGGTINATVDGRYTLGSSTAGVAGSNTIAVNGSTTFASNWSDKGFALGGILSGTGPITIQNTGGHNNQAAQVVVLNNSNTYSGTVTATGTYASGGAGAIVIGGNNVLQFANVVNNVAGGGTNGNGIIFNVTAPVFGSLAGSGGFILTSNTNVFNASAPNVSGTAVALTAGGNNATSTYSGVMSGAGSLTKTGTGTLALSGANTYSGGTTVNNGTIGFASANGANTNLGAGSVTVNAGAILRAGYAVTSNQNISTTAGNITLAGGIIYADDANQHLSGAIIVSTSGTLGSTYNAGNNTAAEKDKGLALDGVVSGAGALTIQHSRFSTGGNYDTSFVSFSNNSNSYSGTITINENTTTAEGGVYLGVNGSTALQNATIATSAVPGSNLRFGSSPIVFKTALGSAAIGAISGSGPLVLTGYDQVNHAYGADAIALTVGGNNATTSYSAAISGLGSLVKTGTGMMTLSGTNTYAGTTTISGGILNVTGTLSSTSGTVTVNNGGSLAGTGTVVRPTTVVSGGAISPANGGSGAAGTLTVSGGLALNAGAVLNMDLAGTATSDKIAVSGTFSASGTTTINLTALGSFAGSGTYPLVTGAAGISSSSFALGSTPSGYVCTLSATGTTLSVTVMTPLENWRSTNFGTTNNSGNAADNADPDSDGMTNSQEFTAGTDPNNAGSMLRVDAIAISGTDVVASFPSVAGKTYRLERSDTLASDSWVTVQTNIAGTGGVVQLTDTGAATQTQRFYRIVTP
ncbi:MAG: autotransporter-associated beta strand repeat-containing protein [Luteolibacter sp.]